MTIDPDEDWKAAFDALPVDPVEPIEYEPEDRQARRARERAEHKAWRKAISDNSDPATNDAMYRRIQQAIIDAGDDPQRWVQFDLTPPSDDDDRHPLADYLIDWSEFWDADADEQEWLLEPLFAQRRAHALYAGAKTGKSYLVLAACAALATGRGFLHQPPGDPVDVLYVDMEMTMEDLRDRMAEFGYGPETDLSHLHYALLPSLPPLDTEAGGEALVAAAKAVGAKFVIIDTTSRAIAGDENDADTLRAFYRHTGLKLKQAGIGWMRLDHAGKDGSKGQRGTSAKNDDVDVVVRLERTDKGQKLTATHRRMSWFPEITELVVKDVDGVTEFSLPPAAVGAGWPAGTKAIADELNALGVDLEASARKASDALRLAGKGHGYKKVQAAVKYRRQVAESAVETLVDNSAKTALDGRERGRDDARARDEASAGEPKRAQSSEPLQIQGSTALGADERGRAHPDSDRARSRASHVVDAPAGPADRGPVDDDDGDPFQ